MVRRAYRQRSLVEVLLPDADKLWDPALRRIDALLEDEVLVDLAAETLEAAYATIGEDIGWRPVRPVRVEILPRISELELETYYIQNILPKKMQN